MLNEDSFCHSEAYVHGISSDSADIYTKVDLLCSKSELHRTRSSQWRVHCLLWSHQHVPTAPDVPTKTPPQDHQHSLTVPPLLCLERAQLLGTSQPSRRPPALPAWRSQCPSLLPIRPSSPCQATWQALREDTSRRKCEQSLTHTWLLPVPGVYTERIWLSSSPLLFACLRSVPGSLEMTPPARTDKAACSTYNFSPTFLWVLVPLESLSSAMVVPQPMGTALTFGDTQAGKNSPSPHVPVTLIMAPLPACFCGLLSSRLCCQRGSVPKPVVSACHEPAPPALPAFLPPKDIA